MRMSQRGQGMVLLVCLVVLLLLGLLGLSAAQTGTLQARLGGNALAAWLTFEAAEMSLREAEARLGLLQPGDWLDLDTAPGAVFEPAVGIRSWRDREGWSPGSSVRLDGGERAPVISTRYLIEHVTTLPLAEAPEAFLGAPDDGREELPAAAAAIFRITVWASLSSGAAETRLQTTYRVDFTDSTAGGRSGRMSWRELESAE